MAPISASWPSRRARCQTGRGGLRRVEARRKLAKTELEREHVKAELAALEARHDGNTLRLAKQLEQLTHLEARVTILGYVQRGGTPSVADRLLATRLGTACAGFIQEGVFGVMVGGARRWRESRADRGGGGQIEDRAGGSSMD